MKYIWNGINTALVFILFMYIYITKDINIQAYDKCLELEQRLELQEERCNHLSEIATKKDTIVINMFKTEKYYQTHYAIK
jgi:hypothetical protein